MLTNMKNKLSEKDIPVLNIPDMCVGGLSSAPGDIVKKHCQQRKRGTSHINIKPFLHKKIVL